MWETAAPRFSTDGVFVGDGYGFNLVSNWKRHGDSGAREQLRPALNYCIEDRLRVVWRAGDEMQDLVCGGLSVDRFSQIAPDEF
jgi:hypothetical protein